MSGPDPLTAFYAALDDNPADQVTLLALADWFEEQDRSDAAACLRWAARHGYRPFHYHRDAGLPFNGADWHDGWFWWARSNPSFGRDWGHETTCRLPDSVWMKLRHSFKYHPAVFKEYPTRQAAYEALIAVWPVVGAGDAVLAVWESSHEH
jgi:uncharacterized protein (TIGR02996 family)